MSTALNPAFLPLAGGTLTGPLTVNGNVTDNGHLQFGGQTPGAAAGANAGTTPPAPVLTTGSNDGAGNVTFGTGTTPASGTMVQMTFNTAWVIPGGGAPHILVTAANAATAALGLYVSGMSPTGFGVSCTTAPAASQGNTTYQFNYVVAG